MTLTNLPPGSGLFVLLALFLTVATVWLLLRAIETRPKEIDLRFFLTLIVVIIPFVMVIYFGLATIICNEIVAARSGADIAFGAGILAEDCACDSYLYRPIHVGMVALAQSGILAVRPEGSR